MQALFDSGGAFRPGFELADEARGLFERVVQCAVKTIVVTSELWKTEVERHWLQRQVLRAFPDGQLDTRVELPYSLKVRRQLSEHELEGDVTGVERERVLAFRVRDRDGKALGLLLRTPWRTGGQRSVVWWGVTAAEIRYVVASGSPQIRAAFGRLRGTSGQRDCRTVTELAGLEMLILAKATGSD